MAPRSASMPKMWRISNDVWDGWNRFVHQPPKRGRFSHGRARYFYGCDRGSDKVGMDAGRMPTCYRSVCWRPIPDGASPGHSRLTLDEGRTQFTLLAIARSPLILGANLTQLDAQTRSLITNRDVISVNQTARDNHPVDHLPMGMEKVRVWVAAANGRDRSQRFLAVFNLDDGPASLDVSWDKLGLPSGSLTARDLWEGHNLPASAGLKIELPAHGCILYAVSPR